MYSYILASLFRKWLCTFGKLHIVMYPVTSQMNNYRRYNPLLDEWVIVAANRVNRPWQGAKTESGSAGFQDTGKTNPLAPGGLRSNGEVRFV